MNVPRSFIDYMKIMRENYKSGASNIEELPTGFNFDDIEVNDSLYGFVSHANDNASDSSIYSMSDSECSKKTAQHEQVITPKTTDIITIELFEHDSILTNTEKNSSNKIASRWTLSKKISAFFRSNAH